MAMHLIKLTFILVLLLLYCTTFTPSSASQSTHLSLPARFFEFAPALAPGSPPLPPSSPPFPPGSPPSTEPPSAPPTLFPPPPSSPPLVQPPQERGSSSGLSGGQKAGITIGTLAGAGLLVFGGMIYMKRRSNIRRARLGSAARTPVL